MLVDMNGVIYSLSYALDCIEAELVGVSLNHAKWVAYLSTLIGGQYGFTQDELSDLSACAALHDNALTQYLSEERSANGEDILGAHCSMGEENVKLFPFHSSTEGFILYHHENADCTGPFKKSVAQTPVQAQIIHMADMIDAACNFHDISSQTYSRVMNYLNEQRGKMFSIELVDKFNSAVPEDKYLALKGREIDDILSETLPHYIQEYDFEKVKLVMDVFGRIVDYKSPFTRNHSEKIADRVYKMALYYKYDITTAQRLYVAAALHDIGKLAIKNDILEKPDKLTDTEFAQIKNHAWFTHVILSKINGFTDILEWASLHHEKLNGQGYPFGMTAEQLNEKSRLVACLDIYQALSEARPYKAKLEHEECVKIMREMAGEGLIDARITNDIAHLFA